MNPRIDNLSKEDLLALKKRIDMQLGIIDLPRPPMLDDDLINIPGLKKSLENYMSTLGTSEDREDNYYYSYEAVVNAFYSPNIYTLDQQSIKVLRRR